MTHPLLSRKELHVTNSFFAPNASLIRQLRTDVQGGLIAPGDPDYDEARTPFNGGIERRPAAIVRVAGDADVSRIVSLARETGLELAGRSGGHSIPGHSVSEGGLVLDLSDMRALDVDVEGRTVWAEAGLTAAADIVTANGEIRRVNSQSGPDLFWAIRGGGGNFGASPGSGCGCTSSRRS